MARINIEDSLFADLRFARLALALGSAEAALGSLVFAWRVAQEYWKLGGLIPEDTWKSRGLSQFIISSGLAEVRDSGIYMRGSTQQFSWLSQRVDAGRKGGQKRAGHDADFPSGRLAVASGRLAKPSKRKQTQANSSKRKPLTLSLSLSHSQTPAPALSQNKEEAQNKNVAEGSKKPTPTAAVWSAYCEAYEEKYGVLPTRNATVNGQLAGFVKRVGEEDAPEIVRFYLTHHNAFYVQKQHGVGPLLVDAEALRTQWLRGRAVLSTEAKAVERVQNNENSWDTAVKVLRDRRERDEETKREA